MRRPRFNLKGSLNRGTITFLVIFAVIAMLIAFGLNAERQRRMTPFTIQEPEVQEVVPQQTVVPPHTAVQEFPLPSSPYPLPTGSQWRVVEIWPDTHQRTVGGQVINYDVIRFELLDSGRSVIGECMNPISKSLPQVNDLYTVNPWGILLPQNPNNQNFLPYKEGNSP